MTPKNQVLADLRNPASVLFIADRPGSEDLSAIAYFRFVRGARVTVVYVTNGESIPDDCGDDTPAITASRRKEEAYECSAKLGADAYFLNCYDPGPLNEERVLESRLLSDSCDSRLQSALVSIQPDVVVLDVGTSDGTTQEPMARAVGAIVRKSISRLRSAGARKRFSIAPEAYQWLFSETSDSVHAFQVNPHSGVFERGSALSRLVLEAEATYASLRSQLRFGRTQRRFYTILESVPRGRRGSFDSPLSELRADFRQIQRRIDAVCRTVARKGAKGSMDEIQSLVDAVSRKIVDGKGGYSRHDLNILGRWKQGLEDLRCALLGVRVEYAADDSTVTSRQLFEFKVAKAAGLPSTGRTYVYFPGNVGEQWIVNETDRRQFPLQVPATFRIITPESMSMDWPMPVHGLARPTLRKDFVFAVIHLDSLRERSFIYQRSIPFKVAPRNAVELLTPVIRLVHGARLVIGLSEFSRDPAEGTIAVEDSLVSFDAVRFSLRGRGDEVLDTLVLRGLEPIADGDYEIPIKIAGRTWGTFTGRKFACTVDNAPAVGVFTGGRRSYLPEAVRQLGLTPHTIDGVEQSRDLAQCRMLLVDRDAWKQSILTATADSEICRWVNAGGRLIILPQSGLAAGAMPLLDGIGFQGGNVVQADAPLVPGVHVSLFQKSNVLGPEDWKGWYFAKAFGTMKVSDAGATEVLVTNAAGNPLVVQRQYGKGTVVSVALNLGIQLRQSVPGAYRLLANLLTF